MTRELKKKAKKKEDTEVKLEVGETFDVGSAKEKDFDLDLDSARFQGKKGQAGTRTKATGYPVKRSTPRATNMKIGRYSRTNSRTFSPWPGESQRAPTSSGMTASGRVSKMIRSRPFSVRRSGTSLGIEPSR